MWIRPRCATWLPLVTCRHQVPQLQPVDRGPPSRAEHDVPSCFLLGPAGLGSQVMATGNGMGRNLNLLEVPARSRSWVTVTKSKKENQGFDLEA